MEQTFSKTIKEPVVEYEYPPEQEAIDEEKYYEKKKLKTAALRPLFASEECAVWLNVAKNGKTYLSIKLADGTILRAFETKRE